MAIVASSCSTANESVVQPTTSALTLPTALIIGEPCGPQESCDVEIVLSGITYWSYEKIPSDRLGDVIAVAAGEFSDGISIHSIIGADSAIEIAVVGEHVMAYRQMPFIEIAGPLMRAGLPPDLDGDFMMAEVGGELELVEGCLHTSGDLVYWPFGTEWDEDTQELSFANGAVARLGDTVIGGGGGWDASRDKGRWGPEVDAFIEKCVGHTGTLSSMNPHPQVQPFDQ